jgi:replicative DNA helicase
MKKGIMIVSLEMPASQIIDRLVAKIGRVSLRSLSIGVRSQGDMDGMARAISELDMADLVIRDDLHDIHSIMGAARAMAKSQSGLGLLLVDYIQLVRCDMGSNSTREGEVAEVSRSLRLLGMELKCLCIGITQLNEQGKARESRAIGHDATAVMIVKQTSDNEERRDILIPIQRNGPSGVQTTLRFNGKTATFDNE